MDRTVITAILIRIVIALITYPPISNERKNKNLSTFGIFMTLAHDDYF